MLKRKDCKNEIKTKYKKEVEDENYNDNDAFDEYCFFETNDPSINSKLKHSTINQF